MTSPSLDRPARSLDQALDQRRAGMWFRFTVWFVNKRCDNDCDHVWGKDADNAIQRAGRFSGGFYRCDPDDWDQAQYPSGRIVSRAEYEREQAA